MNIRNVLIPTDFSEPSRMALNYGIVFARAFGARLTVLHVIEPEPVLGVEFTSVDIEAVESQHREDALRQLDLLLAPEDEDDLDLQVVVKSGNAREQIAAVVSERRADIVVMGTHGRGPLGRFLLGSTTNASLRKLAVPVLTVCHSPATRAFKRILFATDLSDGSRVGFKFALDAAKLLRADLVVMHSVKSFRTEGEFGIRLQDPELAIEGAQRKLADYAAESELHNVKVATLVATGPAAEAIIKTADEREADLIVLTTEKKGVIERVLLGTTAEHLIRETSIPVLSIPVETRQSVAARNSEAIAEPVERR